MGKIPVDNLMWLKSLMPYAVKAEEKWNGMRAVVCVAQAALETRWGKFPIGGWNLWGMKSMEWVPGFVERTTKEWDKGIKEYITVKARFCAFPTAQEGFDAYGRLVTNSKRYALARECKEMKEYVRALAGVWATDPQYMEKVLWIIKESEIA